SWTVRVVAEAGVRVKAAIKQGRSRLLNRLDRAGDDDRVPNRRSRILKDRAARIGREVARTAAVWRDRVGLRAVIRARDGRRRVAGQRDRADRNRRRRWRE